MGDFLRAGKPSWYVTSHQGRLSLLSSEVRSVCGLSSNKIEMMGVDTIAASLLIPINRVISRSGFAMMTTL